MVATAPDFDFIPGTLHLVNVGGNARSQHANGSNQDVLLVPAPSSDPDDPLNWSAWRKRLFLTCICVYCLAVSIASAAIYSVLVDISLATSLTLADMNTGTGYMFLTLGWGNLIWQPLAQKFGKRVVYLSSLLGTMAIMIWAPHATTNGAWIANKVIQGIFGAPIEALCEISIADVYFTHERGTYVGLYVLFLGGANFLAPVISGFINDGQGWQWVLHWCAIFNGVAFLIVFFLMEETKYNRKVIHSVEPGTSDGESAASAAAIAEKGTYDNRVTTDMKKEQNRTDVAHDGDSGSQRRYTKKSYWQKLKIVQMQHVRENVPLKGMIIRPFVFFTFSIVVFCGFMYGAVICYFGALNGTAALILSSPPYSFSSSMLGLSYVSPVIGVFIGAFYAGNFGDRFILWKARRNNGIMEAEHRLWLYLAPLVIIPGGLFLWGVGAARGVHWFGLVFALGVLGCAITIGCQIPIAYCIDCYKDLGADAIVTVILIRNSMSFAIGYGITPWVTNMGYQNTFLVAGFVAMAQVSIFFVMIKYGRRLRKANIARYWKYVQQVQEDGLAH